MNIKDVFISVEAVEDLDEGKAFYNHIELGVGEYYWDSLISDIESLVIYGGIQKKKYGLYRNRYMPPAGQFDLHENFRHAITDVFIVYASNLPGLARYGLANLPDQLLGRLIHAHNRIIRIIRQLIDPSTSSIAATKAALPCGGIFQYFLR